MVKLLALVLGVLLLAGPAAAAAAAAAATERPPVILISIDGFRPDYLDRGVTPNLSALAAGGARAAMRPSFPSLTFPNHYTLVTGLRPDRNGIVDNTMEDPSLPGVTFRMSNKAAVADRRWWDQGEPIWVRAERAGIPTATLFWPGSEAAIRGVRPSRWLPYDEPMPIDARVDLMLGWLDAPEGKPRFLTLYFHHVDTAGHRFGPDSPEVNAAVAEVDAGVGRLIAGLKARGIAANLVIVADHGMASISKDRRVFMEDLLPRDAYRVLGDGPYMTIHPTKGREAEVAGKLLGRHPHFECWRKSKIPKRFHYGRNSRVPPIYCLAETGWTLTRRGDTRTYLGTHGYDPYDPMMAAVFIAHGPGIRSGVTLPPFDNVDVYPLLARLLGVRPARNDGDLDELRAALAR